MIPVAMLLAVLVWVVGVMIHARVSKRVHRPVSKPKLRQFIWKASDYAQWRRFRHTKMSQFYRPPWA